MLDKRFYNVLAAWLIIAGATIFVLPTDTHAQVVKYQENGQTIEFRFDGYEKVNGDNLRIHGQKRDAGLDDYSVTYTDYYKADSWQSYGGSDPLLQALGGNGLLPQTEPSTAPADEENESGSDESTGSSDSDNSSGTEGADESDSGDSNGSSDTGEAGDSNGSEPSNGSSDFDHSSGSSSSSDSSTSNETNGSDGSGSSREPSTDPHDENESSDVPASDELLNENEEEGVLEEEDTIEEVKEIGENEKEKNGGHQRNHSSILELIGYDNVPDYYGVLFKLDRDVTSEDRSNFDPNYDTKVSVVYYEMEDEIALQITDVLNFIDTILEKPGEVAELQKYLNEDDIRALWLLFSDENLADIPQTTYILEFLQSEYDEKTLNVKIESGGVISGVVSFFKSIGSFFTGMFN
ncbi:hypothetical protein [Alteribacter populi]|uniref:hypothetical protein n=1 Tax=Alteribacter populi TaxID=2011011 RepID=UPI000BBB63D6|nr:hypothetical protein [Alteribacter populi]